MPSKVHIVPFLPSLTFDHAHSIAKYCILPYIFGITSTNKDGLQLFVFRL